MPEYFAEQAKAPEPLPQWKCEAQRQANPGKTGSHDIWMVLTSARLQLNHMPACSSLISVEALELEVSERAQRVQTPWKAVQGELKKSRGCVEEHLAIKPTLGLDRLRLH